MPRNGSGTMSVVNSFSSGTTAESAKVNQNFTDVASEITGSLPRDGQAAMTGQFKAASGTVSLPSIAFSSDTDTGFYRYASNTIAVSCGGAIVGAFGTVSGVSGFSDTNGVIVTGIPTGSMMMYGATTAPAGWVRMNARTIGNASSGASERANADTENLFTFLWTHYSDSVCAVSSGRGASAAADYAANKTIALPDLRGRALFGLDDMGNSAASRLGSVVTSQTTNGSSGGAETVTIAQANLPAVQLSVTGTTDDPGNHTHNVPNGQNSFGINSAADNTAVGLDPQTTGGAGAHTHTVTGTTEAMGSGTALANMPPAFLTTFIIKL